MGDCIVTPYVAQQIATKDLNRVTGNIAKCLALNSPFVNILDGGTFAEGTSDFQRSVIQEQANPADSFVQPTFTQTSLIVGTSSATAEGVATTEYSYALGTKRGRGPKIPVQGAYSAYRGSYLMAEDSLKKVVLQYFNADIRYNLLSQSGVKFVVVNSAAYGISAGLTGGESQINVGFANIPAAQVCPLSFPILHSLARHQREVFLAEMFNEGTTDQHYKFIGSSDIIESFRNDLTDAAGVNNTLRAITTGSFKYGEESLTGYSWEGSTAYRGITFGVDQTPLRATGFVNGVPQWVEPRIGVAATNGIAGRSNPAWQQAPYEVGFLIGMHTFERVVPERYTGEGSFKFSPQLAMGELQWHYQIDNDCNAYGDFGWHQYQITRGYRPVRPANVVPIFYQRCLPYQGTPCPTTSLF